MTKIQTVVWAPKLKDKRRTEKIVIVPMKAKRRTNLGRKACPTKAVWQTMTAIFSGKVCRIKVKKGIGFINISPQLQMVMYNIASLFVKKSKIPLFLSNFSVSCMGLLFAQDRDASTKKGAGLDG
ncbi:MAG: hypothetical protein ACOX37_07765 [Bacillota bacterium]